MPKYGESLTEREAELLQLVATGVTNRQVAHQLSISVNTVKVHLRNIYTKLGAESRTEATMIAVREGLVALEGAGTLPTDAESTSPLTQLQFLLLAPEPPLPRFKRLALLAALLIVVAGVAVTWPYDRSQGVALDLPPALESDGSVPQVQAAESSLWREQAQMPTRRAHLATAVAAGRIFAIAGQTPEGSTPVVEIYHPGDDIWTRGADKPTPVSYVSAALIGADILVPGGCDAENTPTNEVEAYSLTDDAWHEVSPLPEPRCAYALAPLDGLLYLFGGWDGERYVGTVFIYDPQAKAWTMGSPMTTERGLAAAAALADRLYVVGGYDGTQELTTCTVYNPAEGTWEECAPLAVGRGGLGLVSLGGQLYAIGGGGRRTYLGFNERYSPNQDRWSAVETPIVGEWRSPGVVVMDNAVYAIGGWSGDYLSLNQVYEPLPFRVFVPITQQK
jgi:DNA-binding CsgD family transcriptional regulator/N-acetylneuraminic acid mutarotase